jgi:chromosome segregation ATPase
MARIKCTVGGVITFVGKGITALLEKIMVKQHLSESLQAEAQKLIPLANQSVIEVTAKKVTEENDLITEKLPQQTPKKSPVKDTMSTHNNLDTTVQELKQSLEHSQSQEKTLQKQVVDLQSALYEKQVLIEKLTKELHETKQTALHLAEANSKLIEESNSKIPGKPNKPAIPEKDNKSAIQVKEKYNPVGYKKSHQVPEYLLERQKEGDNFTDNTWLYD